MISLLRFLIRSSRRIVVLSIVAGAVGGAASVVLVAVIQTELGRAQVGTGRAVWAFAGLCVVAAAARVIAQSAMVRLGQGAVTRLVLQVVGRVLALPLREFEALDRSAILTVLTEDVVLIANALVGVPQLCINGPIVIACLVYVGWIAPAVLVAGLGFAAVAIGVFLRLSRRGMAERRASRGEQDALVGHFRTLIDGFRELKLHRGRREAYLAEGLGPVAESVRRRSARGLTHFAVAEGWSQLMFFGFIGLAMFVLPRYSPIDRPTLVAVVLVVLYLMSPLDVILTWLPVLGRARASVSKVQALLPALERIGAEPGAVMPVAATGSTLRRSIELDGVGFTYRSEREGSGFALGPIDLVLRPGELVVLAGGNGSGKTTLVKLIAGLYPPESGAVRVDGRIVEDAGREAYRQLFSVVFADGHLFPSLVGLDPEGLEARVREGLLRLELAGRVEIAGRAYSTLDLSQGQRRRLALLNAWLEDRPVYVFDEWAANQDARFKRVFYHEILPELKALGKAILVISHDEEYFESADRVLRLQDGRLAEEMPVPMALGS